MTVWPFLFAGAYGVALGLLILSWHLTPVLIRIFVTDDYSLGSHGQVWADWHAFGCLFVGAVNLHVYFHFLDGAAARSIALPTVAIYSVWCVQNFLLMVRAPRRFKSPMWLNVICCGVAAGGSAYFLFL